MSSSKNDNHRGRISAKCLLLHVPLRSFVGDTGQPGLAAGGDSLAEAPLGTGLEIAASPEFHQVTRPGYVPLEASEGCGSKRGRRNAHM